MIFFRCWKLFEILYRSLGDTDNDENDDDNIERHKNFKHQQQQSVCAKCLYHH